MLLGRSASRRSPPTRSRRTRARRNRPRRVRGRRNGRRTSCSAASCWPSGMQRATLRSPGSPGLKELSAACLPSILRWRRFSMKFINGDYCQCRETMQTVTALLGEGLREAPRRSPTEGLLGSAFYPHPWRLPPTVHRLPSMVRSRFDHPSITLRSSFIDPVLILY